MDKLQTKPLIPAWVTKLAEELDNQLGLVNNYECGDLSLNELTELIWRHYLVIVESEPTNE